jgi:peptidoglycan/LPS O-acetylase OafA/YrhL
VLVVFGAAYLLDKLPGQAWVRQLGTTSLFIYWLHLEVVYGQWIAPFARGTLAVGNAAWGVVALVAAMLAASHARTSVDAWRRRRGERLEAGRLSPGDADARVRRPA